MKIVQLSLLALASVNLFAQSAAEFTAKYPVVEVYEIRPGVWMRPQYSVDGQVCEMIVEKRHSHEEGKKTIVDQSSSFTDGEIGDLLDELVPLSVRGEKSPGNWLNSDIVGHSISTVDKYENITVEVDGFLDYDGATFLTEPTASSNKADKNELTFKSDANLVLFIFWPKRPCSNNEAIEKASSTEAISGRVGRSDATSVR